MNNVNRAMRRAERAAARLPSGTAIFVRLQRPDARHLMVAAARRGVPPVTGISALLVAEFPIAELREYRMRQAIGIMVKAILLEEGFEKVRSGVRIKGDPIFSSGSVYLEIADFRVRPWVDRGHAGPWAG